MKRKTTDKPGAGERSKILLQVSKDRKEAWEKAALDQKVIFQKTGTANLSSFIRQAADQVSETGLNILPADKELLYDMYSELSVAGRNINVIAMRVNGLHAIPGLADTWRKKMQLSEDEFVTEGLAALQQHRSVMDRLMRVLERIE